MKFAQYILKRFHNHGFLTAEQTSSGRVKGQEGMDDWQV